MEENDEKKPGTLYLCATPIGNLKDITLRVIETLEEADLIAAEDTRNSSRLLNHFSIHTPLTSYHEHNKYEKAKTLVDQLKAGKNIALITDAGMPGISDPGEELVRQCIGEGINVTSLPGPCALVTALSMSGLPSGRFCFEAFLPDDKRKRQEILEELKYETRTIVLYAAPHDLLADLKELSAVLGAERKVSLCREMTKLHEEVIRTTLGEACRLYEDTDPRGEYVLVIEARSLETAREEERHNWDNVSLADHVRFYEEQGFERKEAMRMAAKDRGISRREVYQALAVSYKEDNDNGAAKGAVKEDEA